MSQVGVGEELSTDVDELQGTVLELDQRLRATTDELELARYRARLERWKEQARGTRRYRRAMGVLEGASTIVDYLLAPFRMIAELLRDVPAPPRPAPPQTGRGSGLSARMADASTTSATPWAWPPGISFHVMSPTMRPPAAAAR